MKLRTKGKVAPPRVDNNNGYVLLRAIAVQPEVDEPASAYDPISPRIELPRT